jgi:hypothetical protein
MVPRTRPPEVILQVCDGPETEPPVPWLIVPTRPQSPDKPDWDKIYC